MQLSIDTSTAIAGVAISEGETVVVESTWSVGLEHTVQLAPVVDELMKRARAHPQELTAIYVAVGPGSFSGLRVGVSTAKGMGIALEIPLVAIGSPEVEAYPFSWTDFPIRPMMNAGRGGIAVAHYRSNCQRLEEVESLSVITLDELPGLITQPSILCGEYVIGNKEQVRNQLGSFAIIPPLTSLVRRPSSLVSLGWMQLEQGHTLDPADVQPVYLREPLITKPKRNLTVRK